MAACVHYEEEPNPLPTTGGQMSAPTSAADFGAANDDRYCLQPLESFLRLSPQPLCVVTVPAACASGAATLASSLRNARGLGSSGGLEPAGPSSGAACAVLPGGKAAGAQVPAAAKEAMATMGALTAPASPGAGSDRTDDDRFPLAEVLYCNDAFADLCGYSCQQLRQGGLEVLLRPPMADGGGGFSTADAAQACRQGLQLLGAALSSGSASRLELPCCHSSGRLLWCSVSLSPEEKGWEAAEEEGRVEDVAGGGTVAATAPADGGWRLRHGFPAGHFQRHVEQKAANGCSGNTSSGSINGSGGGDWVGHGLVIGRGPHRKLGRSGGRIATEDIGECDDRPPDLQRDGEPPFGDRRSHRPGLERHPLQLQQQWSHHEGRYFPNRQLPSLPSQQYHYQQEQQQHGGAQQQRQPESQQEQQEQGQQQQQREQYRGEWQQQPQQQPQQEHDSARHQQQQQQQQQQLDRQQSPQQKQGQQQGGREGSGERRERGLNLPREVASKGGPLPWGNIEGTQPYLDPSRARTAREEGAATTAGRAGWHGTDTHAWAHRCREEQLQRRLWLQRVQLEEREEDEEQTELKQQPNSQRQQKQELQQQQQQSPDQEQPALQTQQKQMMVQRKLRHFLLIFNDITAHKFVQQLLQQLQQQQQQQEHNPALLPLPPSPQPQPLPQQQQQQQRSDARLHPPPPQTSDNNGIPAVTTPVPAPAGAEPPAAASSTPLVTEPCEWSTAATSSLVTGLAEELAAAGCCAACRLHGLALDALQEGITITDASVSDYPIVYTNKAFLNMTGYSREEVLGRNCRFLQGPGSDPAVVQRIREALALHQPVTVQLLNYTRSGVAFWNELRLEPVVAPGSEQLLGYIGVQNDVTELLARRQSEAQLRDAKEAAESAAEAKSQFLANMSHEIRTPLNGMIATAQLLLGSQLTPEQRELTETILESGSTLLGVLGNILDFSKIDHGSLELQRRPMCLRQATEACMDLVAVEATKKGLSLAYLMEDAALARPLLGDPVRIRQVLANLLSNAVKFTERGEVVVRVSVERGGAARGLAPEAAAAPAAVAAVALPASSAVSSGTWQASAQPASAAAAAASSPDDDDSDADDVDDVDDGDDKAGFVHIAVSDTGIGIGTEAAGKLFQHFRQGTETMSRRYGGTGLGLAISKRLAKLMQGDIWVESCLGAGSTFHFTLRAEWAALHVDGAWPSSPSRSIASTPTAASSDCTPRSSTDQSNNSSSAAAAAAAAVLGLDPTGGGRWSNSPNSGAAVRLSSGSGGSDGSGSGGRELRTSPWLPDGTPVDAGDGISSGGDGGEAPMSLSSAPPQRTSGTGCSASGGGGSSAATAAVEVAEERLALVGRTVLIDVSHAPTSTQVWNSCRQMGLAAVQANACALSLTLLPVSPLPPLPPSEPLAAAETAATFDPLASPSAAAAATPPGPRVLQPQYDILIVSMDRLIPALKAGWKGRSVVALGDRELLPPTLQPLVVALAVPVRHGHLMAALIKSTALLRWNGSSAPKLANTPIPSHSIQMFKSWRLKRGTDWENFNRRTSLDNSALERTNLMMRGAGAGGVGEGPGDPGKSGLGREKAQPEARQQQVPIPEHAELPPLPDGDDAVRSGGFSFRPSTQRQGQAQLQLLPLPAQDPGAPGTLSAAAPSTVTPAAAAPVLWASSAGIGASSSGPETPPTPLMPPQQELKLHQQLRILIAEDNKINQKVVLKVLQQILRAPCQPPDVVENGLQVLQALQKKTYDLILMDIHMPEMDGLEASKRIQATYKPEERPRIIALSADTVQTLHDRCRDAGIEAFLVKPFRIEELARVMRTGAQLPRNTAPLGQTDSASGISCCGAPLNA